MVKRMGWCVIPVLILPSMLSAQGFASSDLATFNARLDEYVEMHRRLEGPLPPLAASPDMDEVRRLMDALRGRIRAERQAHFRADGYLLSPAMVRLLRERIASCLTVDDIVETMADIAEHTPPDMPPLRVNEALPEDAPFGMVPPKAIRSLPPLPPELRWVVLSNALAIWDHHADLIVDIAPGVFNAATYRKL